MCPPHCACREHAGGWSVLFSSCVSAAHWSRPTLCTCPESVRQAVRSSSQKKNILARARGHARRQTPRGFFSTLLPLLLSHILILPEAALCFPEPPKKKKMLQHVLLFSSPGSLWFFWKNPTIFSPKNLTCVQWKAILQHCASRS